jgi:hypothetical protein
MINRQQYLNNEKPLQIPQKRLTVNNTSVYQIEVLLTVIGDDVLLTVNQS